jgi:integrase
MASIQKLVRTRTGTTSYRAQVRVKGYSTQSECFPNRKEALEWATQIEAAIRQGKHFPHAAARRETFDSLARDYIDTVLVEFDAKERKTRIRQLTWWSAQFSGLSLFEVTADRISRARDKLGVETFARGKMQKDPETGGVIVPKQYKRTGATVNRYIATLSHVLSFAVKERRLLERNPVADISRKKEPRGRTRFLSDEERTRLLEACKASDWAPLRALVLLAITTGCLGSTSTLTRTGTMFW